MTTSITLDYEHGYRLQQDNATDGNRAWERIGGATKRYDPTGSTGDGDKPLLVCKPIYSRFGGGVGLFELGQKFQDVLGHALDGVKQVAIVDFPDHNNVGDSAIWLGEMQALKNLGIETSFVASSYNYSPNRLAAFLAKRPSAALLIHGGGNFGGLYRHHEEVRESVLQRFSDRRIVQLPQSVTWASSPHRTYIYELAKACQNLTLMVRDSRSAERLEAINAEIVLSPDAAHAIKWEQFLGSPGPPKLLARADGEVAPSDANFTSVQITALDWPSDSRRPLLQIAADATLRHGFPLSAAMLQGQAERFNGKALFRLRDGIQHLGQPARLVTNRLHGMIIGLHLGSQLYVSDNAHGKLKSYIETWSLRDTQPLLAFESLQEATRALQAHLAHGDADPSPR